MAKFWRVAVHEYLRHVLRRRFLFALLSLPLVIVAMVAVAGISVLIEVNPKPAGYVDAAGWLESLAVEPSGEEEGLFSRAELIEFPDEASARSALDQEDIQAYYVIDANYDETGTVRLVAYDDPGENVKEAFANLMQRSLLADMPEQISLRVLEGSNVVVRSTTDAREAGAENWFNLILPIFAGVIFIVVINMSGGYLLQAVVEEKENRTMEIVVTSVSPTQLMAGKIVGNLSVGLTQMLVWAFFPALGFFILRNQVPFLQAVKIDPQFGWLSVLTLLLAFIMVAALMAMVGATATEAREAQQVAGLFTLPLVMPYWFTSQIMFNPNGAFATALSIIPLTSPLSLPLRAAFTHVPEWQVALSLGLLAASAILAIWLAGRAFRLGMLRYGKRLKLTEIFSRR